MNLPLRQLAGNQLALKGAHGEQRIHLGVRLDEMVVRAHLNLAVTPSPALLPNLSHLQVRLNDKLLSVIPLRADHAGERIERRIELDPRLFVDDNWLSLRLVGHYTLACEDPLHSSLWADVDVDATGFELTIRPLALEDELALFPAPWFDRRSAGRVEVPMVLGLQPSQERLSTASIMASWLGSLAGERGASFPVRRDRLTSNTSMTPWAITSATFACAKWHAASGSPCDTRQMGATTRQAPSRLSRASAATNS
ncbi:cellulose biosynthesis cyclic di-GMP-binding regulatory protein BcsB [Hydrogenophaga sp.]|uniref:cellulose biosynthesis cyclic di-GMP-binding regulatory protein BcsB n=1 Tax=Hydrogenophaga sp. TaxID=1904254 RepID=UPI00260920AC|nr:cellulose biosynthesis cyclic di-GMP-binding regulatory protein BcsB [Hydrogenophaga sp.]